MNNLELTQNQNIFEQIKHVDDAGNEYWLARELMPLLEYKTWEYFHKTVRRAIKSLEKTYPQSTDHFREVTKKIKIAVGTEKEAERSVTDYKLSRRACYLIAQNGDSSKKAIALAQNYFASQTRKQEIREQQEKEIQRIIARRKLTETEKKFGGVLTERGIDSKGIAEIKSAGDQALFGSPTKSVKQKLGIKGKKPLADHLPVISLKAKDLATEMTTYKTEHQNLNVKQTIKREHISNNTSVRNMLTENGIYPERLPAEEDVKKLERRYSPEEIAEIEAEKILAMDLLEINISEIIDQQELMNISNLISDNPGSQLIRIYYGDDSDQLKMIEREVNFTPELLDSLRKYLVIADD